MNHWFYKEKFDTDHYWVLNGLNVKWVKLHLQCNYECKYEQAELTQNN